MHVAAVSSLTQEFLVPRTARSEKPAEESFGERLARLCKACSSTQTERGEIRDLSRRMMTYDEREEGRPPAHLLGIKLVAGLLAGQKLNSRGTRR